MLGYVEPIKRCVRFRLDWMQRSFSRWSAICMVQHAPTCGKLAPALALQGHWSDRWSCWSCGPAVD